MLIFYRAKNKVPIIIIIIIIIHSPVLIVTKIHRFSLHVWVSKHVYLVVF